MNLLAQIQAHAQQAPQRPALRCAAEVVSYGALWAQVETATTSLQALGIQPGDRVAWLGFNHPKLIVLLLALARLGAVLLPLNYRLAPPELQAILKCAGATLLIANNPHSMLGIPDETLKIVSAHVLQAPAGPEPGEFSKTAHRQRSKNTFTPGQSTQGALAIETVPALLVYTSGTAGLPKAALHTLANLTANCQISIALHGMSAADHVLTVLPLFHVGGLCIQTLPALYAGATVTLHDKFDAARWLHDVQTLQPSLSLMVPATLKAVIEHAQFAATDLSSLRLLSAGSSTVPQHMIAAFHARGVPVAQVYGATETGPVSIGLTAAEALQHVGSAGRACAGVQVRLVGAGQNDVARGTVGEIWLRGPNVMQAYWQDSGNPAFQNGWFHTGDLACQDAEGFYWVVGRSKDMIISGGENIYPAEIENILAASPRIAEVAVVGVPDEKWGEAVVAVVVPNLAQTEGAAIEPALTESDVLQLLHGQLARFKWPRSVVFRTALPKTALGKVIKAELFNEYV